MTKLGKNLIFAALVVLDYLACQILYTLLVTQYDWPLQAERVAAASFLVLLIFIVMWRAK